MRYLAFIFIVVLFASCKKYDPNSNIVETHYKYRNTTNYRIDLNVYRKSVSLIQFNYTIRPYDSLELDYRNVDIAAPPFGVPEVDSAEVIFDGSRRIIYTLEGQNGIEKPRNIFNQKDAAYGVYKAVDGKFNYTYDFTNTDYYNAQ